MHTFDFAKTYLWYNVSWSGLTQAIRWHANYLEEKRKEQRCELTFYEDAISVKEFATIYALKLFNFPVASDGSMIDYQFQLSQFIDHVDDSVIVLKATSHADCMRDLLIYQDVITLTPENDQIKFSFESKLVFNDNLFGAEKELFEIMQKVITYRHEKHAKTFINELIELDETSNA
jgi:hypothetical protein